MDTFLFTKAPEGWSDFFRSQSELPYWTELKSFVEAEYRNETVYPKPHDVFAAFHAIRPEEIKCILLGQDPYHGPSQAMGLSFSVRKDVKIPPSLRNIFKEYCSDLEYPMPVNGDLTNWAEEGIFLINSVLTVRGGQAGSHSKKGWEEFVFNAVCYVLSKSVDVGFLCLGAPAQRLAQKALEATPESRPIIVSTPHPSPLSAYRGFFGSKPFTTFNNQQRESGRKTVNWKLPSGAQKSLF